MVQRESLCAMRCCFVEDTFFFLVVDIGVLSGNLILVIKVRTMEYSSIFMVLLYCASELSNSSVHLQAGIYI